MRTKKKVKPDRRNNGCPTPPSNFRHVAWQWSKNGKPDPAILADIVKRIVRAAKPEKIVLFGSAARSEMGPNSDYDLLVIKGGKFNHWRVLDTIDEHLSGKEAPVDVVLVTPEDVERYRDAFCLVICPALEEGKVVYDSRQTVVINSRARPSQLFQRRSRMTTSDEIRVMKRTDRTTSGAAGSISASGESMLQPACSVT